MTFEIYLSNAMTKLTLVLLFFKFQIVKRIIKIISVIVIHVMHSLVFLKLHLYDTLINTDTPSVNMHMGVLV